ncbi:MAG: helix-turn-helix domain-containing protein [Candidatus Jidaibacter sp.]|jgi:cytoskeletal protein RodZ|nr:helix-turn-helix domain-containing protein [Candidatus Jidaibacter sp.]
MNRDELKNIGSELRKHRLAAKVSIDKVAKTLKIRKTYLQAIEKGNADLLKFDTYTIGYIKQYAEFLELNPNNYLERIKSKNPNLLPAISSNNLITGKEFLPGRGTIIISIFFLVFIYIFIEFAI